MKVGDEFGHYYVNADGRTMLRNADGKLRVADDDAIKAVKKQAYQRRRQLSRSNNVSPVTGSKYHGIGHFSAPFPRTGKSKGLVFLVEFTDVKFRLSDPKEYFTPPAQRTRFQRGRGTRFCSRLFPGAVARLVRSHL